MTLLDRAVVRAIRCPVSLFVHQYQDFTGANATFAMSLWQIEFVSPLSQTILTALQSFSTTLPRSALRPSQ
jgi:hypothetical protein